LARVRQHEDGFTLVELLVAVTVLSIAAAAFGSTTSQGLHLIGTSQERQTVVAVATASMEESRAYPYESLELRADSSFSAGSGTPDADVSGTTYHVPVPVDADEELVISSLPDSGVVHVVQAEPAQVPYDVYRYVTWVASGADPHAYKRVTVVVQWAG